MSSTPKHPRLVVTKILETNFSRSARSDALLAKNLFLKPKRDVFGGNDILFF